jgi:hypothetical protein
MLRVQANPLIGTARRVPQPPDGRSIAGSRGSPVSTRVLCALGRPQRWLAGLAGRPLREPRRGHNPGSLPNAHADHGRELRGRAARRARNVRADLVGNDHRRPSHAAARPTADLPRRVRLSRFRPVGCPARPGPVHARSRPGAHRPRLPVRGLALPKFALRPTVHALELRDRPARRGRRVMGVEGARGRHQPRGDRAGEPRGRKAGPLAALRRRLCGPEPGATRVGGRWCSQRHAPAAGTRRRAGAHRRNQPAFSRRRSRTGCGDWDQGDRRAGAAVSPTRTAKQA